MKISQKIVCIIKGFHQAVIVLLHAPNHACLELFKYSLFGIDDSDHYYLLSSRGI
jgi:hypothetical protein